MNEDLGITYVRTGDPANPKAMSSAEAGYVRDAFLAAKKGTGPYAALASAFDNIVAGLIPGAREAFQDTQANRQFLRALIVLGRSALVVNPRFPVAEMSLVAKLFPDPDAFFANPETEANKFVELKNMALAQKRSNLEALQLGIEDTATRQAVQANNFELDRLLGLIKSVPSGPIGPSLDMDAVGSLRDVIRESKPAAAVPGGSSNGR